MSPAHAPVAALARNRCMVRVCGVWLLFVVNEYAVWTAVLVFAFTRHGTTGAALVSVAQLLPAAVCAPAVAAVADRRSPSGVLRGGLALQVVALAVAAAAMAGRAPEPVAYLGAVVAATSVVAVRPALALVVPGVARDAAELAAANAVVGGLEWIGALSAGVLVGAVLGRLGPAAVLVVAAGLLVAGVALCGRVRVARLDDAPAGGPTGVPTAVRTVAGRGHLRVLVALLAAGAVVMGGLDVLFVVLADDVLGRGPAGAGYLTAAFGVGGVLALGITAVVLGHTQTGRAVVLAVVGLALAVGATAATDALVPVLALVVVAGAAHAVVDVGARALLQRQVDPARVGAVFGLVEGLVMAGMAAGALLVPVAVAVGGTTAAVLAVATAGPLALLVGGRAVRHLDDGEHHPLPEVSLLRQSGAFATTPLAVLSDLARAADRVSLEAGETLPSGLVLLAGGLVDERCGSGPPVTRRRGEVITGPAVALTRVTAYRLDRVRVGTLPGVGPAALRRFEVTAQPIRPDIAERAGGDDRRPTVRRPPAAAGRGGSAGTPPPPAPR